MSELAQGVKFLSLPLQVCSYFMYTPRIIWNIVQYLKLIPISGTSLYFFQITAGSI